MTENSRATSAHGAGSDNGVESDNGAPPVPAAAPDVQPRRGARRVKLGTRAVTHKKHTVILGWSSRIFPIISELAIANSNVRKAAVVILTNSDSSALEEEIRSRTGELGKLSVMIRRGDPTNPRDLARVNVGAAKSIIILGNAQSGDAAAVATVLAVRASIDNPTIAIVAEVNDTETARALTSATKGQLHAVRSQDVIARITAQATRQAGLATVVLDLLNFTGDEIYFSSIPALEGKTYGDAVLAFNRASVIGILDEAGISHLNPKPSTTIARGARIIAIAEDDDRVTYTGVEKTEAPVVPRRAAKVKPAEHILVVGWSSMGRLVLAERARFLPKGSSVHIVAKPEFVDPRELAAVKFGGVSTSVSVTSGDLAELTKAVRAKHYDQVIVLGYRNAIGESDADAQTLLTVLQLRALFDDESSTVRAAPVIAEILDSRNAELARVAGADDLVISGNLAAMVVAQVAENPALSSIFTELLGAKGASIVMRNVEVYAPLGVRVAFSQLVAAGVAKGESVIGYRIVAESKSGGAQGVILNPAKHDELVPEPGDMLIAVGND